MKQLQASVVSVEFLSIAFSTTGSLQDMLRKLAGGLGQDESFQLPKLMEMSRCQVLAQAKQREAKQRFSTLAKAKIGALQQLAAFAQGQPQDEPTFGVRDVLIRDLLSLCRSFGGRAQNLGGWPQEVWQTARKWPSYYKHDLFWGLIDAIELFKAPAHSWTAHTLCLSHLVRALPACYEPICVDPALLAT